MVVCQGHNLAWILYMKLAIMMVFHLLLICHQKDLQLEFSYLLSIAFTFTKWTDSLLLV